MYNIPDVRDDAELFGVVSEVVPHVLRLHPFEAGHDPAEIVVEVERQMDAIVD